MKGGCLVAADVGGGATKVAAFTTKGRLLGRGRVNYRPTQPSPGVAEYDAGQLCTSVLNALAQLGSRTDLARAEVVAVDAMVSGAVAVDGAAAPISPYTTNMDTRANRQLSPMLQRHGADILRLTGSTQPTLASKIAWIREDFSEIARNAAKYVTAGGLVTGFLSGHSAEDLVIDPTCLWSTGLSDALGECWSPELCAYLDVSVDELPRIAQSTEVVGHVTSAVAGRTGLRSGTPIVAGCGDGPAGLLGAGAARIGKVAEVTGTYGSVTCTTAEFNPGVTGDAATFAASVTPGLWTVHRVFLGSGLTRQWASELFGTTGRAAGLGARTLDEAASHIEVGSDGLFFVPHLGGQMYPVRPHLRGSWLGLTWAHGRGHLYRSLLEALAYEVELSLQVMVLACPDSRDTEAITLFGGGSRSELWNQIRSDVVGKPYESLGYGPITEMGAALLGGQGVNLVDNPSETAISRRQVSHRYSPNSEHHSKYAELVRRYKMCVESTSTLYQDLNRPRP
jgi:xylulokinase